MSQNGNEFLSKTPLDCRSKTDSMATASFCSCSICDSISCFKLRNKNSATSCSCSTCRPSIPCSAKCCLNISTETIKDKPNSKKGKKQIEKQCIHESINNQKQGVHKSTNAKKQIVCESSNDKKQNIREPIKNKKSEIDKHSHTKIKSKDKTDEKKITKYYEKSLTQIESIVLTYTKNNKDTCPDSNEKPPKTNEQIIPDILTRLKEIYKVCSCKVCECIPKISLPPKEKCTCTPCDCAECTNPNKHTDFSCDKCVKKDCRGIAKKNEEGGSCNCKPCECLECMDRSNKLCNCEPCQCVECAKNTLGKKTSIIIAHVQENFSPNTCQCEPCVCADCTHNNSTITTNLRRDISSDISYRHSQYATCLNDIWQLDRCDENKIIRKSVQSDSHDDDIHKTVLSDQNVRKYYNNFDTIAMIALSDNYSNSVFNSKENCKCLECECLMCKKRDKDYTNKKSSKYLSQDLGVTTRLNNTCKCVPCECEICTSTQNKIDRSYSLNTKKSPYNGYACNFSDCVLCKGIRYHSNTAKEKTAHFNLEPATKDISYENTFPSKKGKLLTPLTFEDKLISPPLQSCFYDKKVKKPAERRVSLKVNSKESFHTKLSNHQKCAICCTDLKQILLESKNSQQMFYKNSIKNNFLGNVNFTNQVRDHNETDMVSSNSNIHLGKSGANSNIFNNNLHIPLNVNMKKSIENYLVADRKSETKLAVDDFDSNTIVLDSNVVDNNIDESKLHMIKSEQIKLQEKDDVTRKTSILAIYKSPSKSTLCDNISIARHSKEANIVDSENRNSIYLQPPEGDRFAEPLFDKSNSIIANSKIVIKINETIHRDILNNKKKNNRLTKRIPMYSKMYRRLLKRIRVSEIKKTRRQRRLQISNSNNENNKAKERLENNLEKKIENCLDLTNDIRNSINTYFLPELNILNKIKTEVENIDKSVFNMPWLILRKNISLNCTAVRRNTGVCPIPDSEMGIKCSVKSVSTSSDDYDNNIQAKKALTLQIQNKYNDAITQTIALNIRIDKDTNCNVWKSMKNLQSNMKYLLQMILARAVNKSDVMTPKLNSVEGLSDDLPKLDSVKSSCEGLKAIFIGVRKISNHTLFVRWKMPPKVADVLGYELQVDGRSVQKIFSPTRCMAILTCLPHYDKILLTIRTLTASDIPSDHYPATSIVYRPKDK